MRVGVIGAGVAGLTLAQRLRQAGHDVLVLDKGRGVGGRASTRCKESRSFDHGAQYFTIRDPAFRAFLEAEVPTDRYAVWSARFARLEGDRLVPESLLTPRYVGVPGMSSLCQALEKRLEVRTQVRITRLTGLAGHWRLIDTEGGSFGPFDWVVSTAPPVQSAAIFEGRGPITDEMKGVQMSPCFSLMMVPAGTSTFPADGIRCNHSVLGWVANDHSKPGRQAGPTLVVQSNHTWAETHKDDPLPGVTYALKESAEDAFKIDLRSSKVESLQRWLYAAPVKPLEGPCLLDVKNRLAACGDWCVAGKIEGAFLSGDTCARLLLSD